jgi:hypothetical protein
VLLWLGGESYADGTLTGPLVAWMIQNKAGFIDDADSAAADRAAHIGWTR